MKCPNCNENLQMAERHQTEVDYCPRCRGIWLDRGELDHIIERAGVMVRPMDTTAQRRADEVSMAPHPHANRRKRQSLLGEIFDFD